MQRFHNQTDPPKWAIHFLSWFCPSSFYETIEGDLIEQFELDVQEVGYKRARRRFLRNVLKFFRLGIVLRNKVLTNQRHWIMFQNYWILALRHLGKRKGFAVINILGLAIGLAAAILIFQYVSFESSYDRFQLLHQRIFRIGVIKQDENQVESKSAYTFPALGPITRELSHVEDHFRLVSWAGNYTVQAVNNPDKIIKEESAIFADPAFIKYFNLSFLFGNSTNALINPNHVIISEETYHKYFGDLNTNPVGQTLLVHNSNGDLALEFVIDGVFKSLPENSHVNYAIIFTHLSLPNFLPKEIPENDRLTMFENSMGPETWYTYIVIQDGVDPLVIEKQINNLVQKKSGSPKPDRYILQPVPDIHLDTSFSNEPSPTINPQLLTWLTIIGCIILAIAWINYINLSTARITERIKETGLRKVIGAQRIQLIWQFLTEAWLMNTFAILVCILIVFSVWPYFQVMVGKQIPFDLTDNFAFWKIGLTWFFIGTCCTALYPALVMSSFSPLLLLNQKLGKKTQSAWFRRMLVVVQFSSSLILLIGTMAIYRQVHFMQGQKLGIETERILIVEGPNVVDQQTSIQQAVSTFRNKVLSLRGVEGVSASSAVPGNRKNDFSKLVRKGDDIANAKVVADIRIDPDYFKTIGIRQIAGRDFSENAEFNQNSLILNEIATTRLGFPTPSAAIGSIVGLNNAWGVQDFEVIGVVENFHQHSLHENYEPIVFFSDMFGADLAIRLSPNASLEKTLAELRTNWNSVFPGNPFDYYFLDDFYNRQYTGDLRFGSIFLVFAILAIIISSLGLFGLASYTMVRRSKELSIRKVMGATARQIMALLSFEFMGLVIIASFIALPLAFLAIQKWLNAYAYKMPIRYDMFIVPMVIIFVIALLTIGFQTFHGSRTNPADSLRHE